MIKRYFRRHPIRTKRALEILPGFTSWFLILFPIWGSFLVPKFVAYYVIVFAVYWLYRSINLAIFASIAQNKVKKNSKNDILPKLKKQFPQRWQTIHHLIIIPTFQEPLSTLENTLLGLSKQSFPRKNIHIMLSFEEREGNEADKKAAYLEKKFGKVFGHLWSTKHPDIPGEIKGKSSNTAWGARKAKKLLVDQVGIPLENITITSEDADAILHPYYFSYLTHSFLTSKKPYNKSWQAGICFYNNIWQVPAPIRVLAATQSVTQIYILARRDRLINFSTYSVSLKHIEDIGYWDTDVIPEDYRLFFKSYFAKDGDFEVEPIFLPIYADAAQSTGFWSSMRNQYEQIKRWAWGVSDDAYIIRHYVLSDKAPFIDKTLRVFKVIEDHFLWPVNWFAITVSAMLPPLLNQQFSRTIIGKTLPQVSSTLLTMSMISMLSIFVIDAKNRPPRPNKNFWSYISQPLEFLLIPVVGFFFSALPGMDAHTRLMFGKYLEYRVTEKVANPQKDK
ncbi:MAG: glycosyltransferase family 2 protein [Candidatus Pacebacteria bacterium]|nr:glycosyltransferase family 2 protein [Candidatus Paceibacterota bacterium]